MGISWLSVLQAVPWTEVISNAPKVAEGARKLWKSAGNRGAPADDAAGAQDPVVDTPTTAPADAAVAQLQPRLPSCDPMPRSGRSTSTSVHAK